MTHSQEDCIFCKIVSGKSPSSKLFEDDDVYVFLDVQPVNPGHTLIIPKVHTEFIGELPDELLGKLMITAKKVEEMIRKTKLKAEGFNLFLADGEVAFQEVFHVHLHVIPRYAGDGFGLTFPSGYENKPSKEELEKICNEIKTKMNL